MDKFSLYDLLGLLFPGLFFLYLFQLELNLLEISSFSIQMTLKSDWILFLFLGLLIGSLLYVTSFAIVQKKFFVRFFPVYHGVLRIYNNMPFMHDMFANTFNKKAREWTDKDVFIRKDSYDLLDEKQQKLQEDLQDEFYDRMYYELEYLAKIDVSKSFQSFYFFFRQSLLAAILLLLLALILFLYSFSHISVKQSICAIGIPLLFCILFTRLAMWYRKQMILKMYYTYFTHLNLTQNGNTATNK